MQLQPLSPNNIQVTLGVTSLASSLTAVTWRAFEPWLCCADDIPKRSKQPPNSPLIFSHQARVSYPIQPCRQIGPTLPFLQTPQKTFLTFLKLRSKIMWGLPHTRRFARCRWVGLLCLRVFLGTIGLSVQWKKAYHTGNQTSSRMLEGI